MGKPTTGSAGLPPDTLAKNRAHGYQNVLGGDGLTSGLTSTAVCFVLCSFFATPWGVWMLLFACSTCGAFFVDEALVLAHPYLCILATSLLTSCLSIAGFIVVARYWDYLYSSNPNTRCQPTKSYDNTALLGRLEVKLTAMNLVLTAFASACVIVGKMKWGYGAFYLDVDDYGWGYLLCSCVLYFVWIDLWAYVAHRSLHFPWLYKHVHKVHHTWKQPTAFTAMGLHPCEIVFLQGGVYVAFYVFPLHVGVIACNLLYMHYHNIVDHSGVYCESPLPWQPTSLYHDDHHRLFHVNYGQFLTIWDKLGNTFYAPARTYGEDKFSY